MSRDQDQGATLPAIRLQTVASDAEDDAFVLIDALTGYDPTAERNRDIVDGANRATSRGSPATASPDAPTT